MTGPSLAGVWDRKAGTLKSFSRYSPVLTSANIVWNDKNLDDWIADPQHLVRVADSAFGQNLMSGCGHEADVAK